MTDEDRERAPIDIRECIDRSDYHIHFASQGMNPRFAYTIGLSPKIGKEIILAGAILYMG